MTSEMESTYLNIDFEYQSNLYKELNFRPTRGVCSGEFVQEGLFRGVCLGGFVQEGLFRRVCSGGFVQEGLFRGVCLGGFVQELSLIHI